VLSVLRCKNTVATNVPLMDTLKYPSVRAPVLKVFSAVIVTVDKVAIIKSF